MTRYQTTYNNLSKSLEDLRLAEAQTTDNIVLTTPAQPADQPDPAPCPVQHPAGGSRGRAAWAWASPS